MKKILIIDDSEEFVSTLSDFIPKDKYKVTIAKNGVEGLEAFIADEPDLVLLDIMMPKMGGLKFIEELKKRELKSHIIISSQLDQESTIGRALEIGLEVGVEGYIIKSSESSEMIVKEIDRVLEE